MRHSIMGDGVTVLLPHYRCEQFLRQAASSILRQDHTDLQLWVLDDASPTTAWLDQISDLRSDPRLRLFRSDRNVGPYRLKNRCLAIGIPGKYVAFQDADDYSTPDRLRKLIAALRRRNLHLIGSSIWLVNEANQVVGKRCMPIYAGVMERLGARYVVHHPASLVSRTVLEAVGGFDGTTRIAADTDFLLRAAHRYSIGNVREPLYYYRKRTDSLTADPQTGHGTSLRTAYNKDVLERHRARKRLGLRADLSAAPCNVDFELMQIK